MKFHVNDLPTELIGEIFEFLDIKSRFKAERCCRLWKNISRGTPWYCHDTIRISERDLQLASCRTFIRKFGFRLKSIDLTDIITLVPETIARTQWLKRNVKYLKNLEEISVANSHVDDRTLSYFAENCSKLRLFDLSGNSTFNRLSDVKEETVNQILRKCPIRTLRLEDLRFTGCDLFEGVHCSTLRSLSLTDMSCLKSFGKYCPDTFRNIEDLDFRFCPNLSRTVLTDIMCGASKLKNVTSEVTPDRRCWRTCTELSLISLCGYDVCDDDVLEISRHCKKVRELELRVTMSLTDRSLGYFSDFPALRLLYFVHNERMSKKSVRLLENCVATEISIFCGGCLGKKGVVLLMARCRNMNKLQIFPKFHGVDSGTAEALGFICSVGSDWCDPTEFIRISA